MLQAILLICGIIAAGQRPRLRKLTPAEFPSIDASRVIEWQTAELKALDAFLWATWGVFRLEIAIAAGVATGLRLGMDELAFSGLMIGIWVVGLVIAGTLGSKAKKLRTAAGIK